MHFARGGVFLRDFRLIRDAVCGQVLWQNGGFLKTALVRMNRIRNGLFRTALAFSLALGCSPGARSAPAQASAEGKAASVSDLNRQSDAGAGTIAAARPETGAFRDDPNGPIYDFIVQQHRETGERFKTGDTNAPLLILEWFLNSQCAMCRRVDRTGHAIGTDHGRLFANGRQALLLDPTRLGQLVRTINVLPAAPSRPPQDRWLVVSGIRSNEWFTAIYDRADIPPPVERLFEIIALGRPPWIVGDANTSTNVAGRYGDTWVTSLRTAAGAPLAASVSAVASGRTSNSVQLWDTENWKQIMVPAIEEFMMWPWDSVALSSNGQYVVVTGEHTVRNVDRSSGKIRWEIPFPHGDGNRIRQLVFVHNDERLAVAFQNSVEIWDSATGKTSGVLETNADIALLTASLDGRLLAFVSDKKKVQVWDAESWSEVRETTEAAQSVGAMAFSPDATHLALSGFPYRDSFALWDLTTGGRTVIAARADEYMDDIADLAWSPDGRRLAVTLRGREVLIYDAHTWKPVARWPGVSGRIAFANTGMLLSRLNDGTLRALDVPGLIQTRVRP